MTGLYLAGLLVLGAVLGVGFRKLFGRSNLVQPNWGEIGVLAICTAWFLGVLLYGTPLEDTTGFLRLAPFALTGVTGLFWGLHLGWSRNSRGKRWAGYVVIVGSVAAVLFL